MKAGALPRALVFVAALLTFGAALLYNLADADVENDEAIYSFAVERMIDGGGWLTPQTIPTGAAFLEKPPLKFWMVAAPIRVGLLPNSQFGLRFVDALLGAIAFAYVAVFGYRLGGLACAVASPMILFGLRDFVLLHSLRTNNMEASLVAAYAGGLYHFIRWREDGRRRDAYVTGAWFTLAFMTKFVAAAFMPLVALVSLAVPLDGARLPKPLRAAAADWGITAAVIVLVSAPWFVYQYLQVGRFLIDTMFMQHVFVRFTGALDPQHLRPWDYYYGHIFWQLQNARCEWLAAAGAALLVNRIAARRDPLARTLVVWAVLPIALISGLSSKLGHYAYPFYAPIALAGGLALSAPINLLREPLERLAARLETSRWFQGRSVLTGPMLRRIGLGLGILALIVAAWALIAGPTKTSLWGVTIRNSSIMRPLIVAVIGFAVANAWRHALTIAPVALMSLLPLSAAKDTLYWAGRPAHALHAIGDCARTLVAEGKIAGGAYGVSEIGTPHSYYYYFLATGDWIEPPDEAALDAALHRPGAQRPIVFSQHAFSTLALKQLHDPRPMPPAVRTPPGWTVVLPGPLGVCLDPAVVAGGRSVGGTYAPAGSAGGAR
jgi:4-amino-4-deoxy-L-arabinose transferase-like glycosyltransferase